MFIFDIYYPAKTCFSMLYPWLMSTNYNSEKIDQWQCLDDENLVDEPISISTASSLIDEYFFPVFHGVPLKSITEVFGFPGSGKTCFA